MCVFPRRFVLCFSKEWKFSSRNYGCMLLVVRNKSLFLNIPHLSLAACRATGVLCPVYAVTLSEGPRATGETSHLLKLDLPN